MWDETLKTYHEMIVDEGWSGKDSVSIDSINDYTQKVSYIIALALPTWILSSSACPHPNI